MYSVGLYSINTSDMRQSKTFILSTNVDLRSLETEFLIAVCSPTVNYSYIEVAVILDWFGYVFSRPIFNKPFRYAAIENVYTFVNVDLRSLETEFLIAALLADSKVFLVAIVLDWFGCVFSRPIFNKHLR